jgi:glycosyltransferase involved in cell wall biosynthesis
VIVPARNAAGKVGRLIAAMEGQTASRELFELVIVDDCSSDETAAAVRASGVTTLIELPARGGAYVARNRGIEGARGEILAFTDADCQPAPDWIECGLRSLQSSGADLIAGRFDVPLGERPSIAELVDFASFYDQEDFVSRGVAATGNLWIRRNVISDIGGFDESLMSGGDMDLTGRAVGAGYRLEYDGAVVVTHAPESYWHLAKKGYRLGEAAAARGQSHLRSWMRGGDPEWRAARRQRPADHGLELRLRQRISMSLVRNFVIRLPIAAGNLAGMVARLRDRARN